jgi:hypothetical protein
MMGTSKDLGGLANETLFFFRGVGTVYTVTTEVSQNIVHVRQQELSDEVYNAF